MNKSDAVSDDYVGWTHRDREELGGLRARMTQFERGLTEISAAVHGLAAKFDKTQEPKWQAYGVMVTVMIAIGGLLYWPIRETQADLKASNNELIFRIGGIGDRFMTIREGDARSARGAIDLKRLGDDVNQIEQQLVPRGELTERWRSFEGSLGNMQRQLDDQKKLFGDTFSLRDALQTMQRRLDILETGKGKS